MNKEDKTKNKSKTVVLCCGSKGGVGKSLCAGSLTDCLLEAKRSVALVDCDKANADAALWSGKLPANLHLIVPLTNEWDPLLDELPEIPADVVIVNMGAGDAPLFVNEGDLLRRVAEDDGLRVILAYMLSPTFGSIRPLFQVANSVRPWAELCVLKNNYFPGEHWELWELMTVGNNQTVVSKSVRALGITELDFPLLPGRLLLEAHRPGFNGLLAAEQTFHGAMRQRTIDYRRAVARLVTGMNL